MPYQAEYLIESYEGACRFFVWLKRIVLVAGILIGILPAASYAADAPAKRGGSSRTRTQLAQKLFQAKRKTEQVAQAVYAALENGGGPKEMGQAAGAAASRVIGRLKKEIAEAANRIAKLHAVGAAVPRGLSEEIRTKKDKIGHIVGQVVEVAGLVARKSGVGPLGEGQAIGTAIQGLPHPEPGMGHGFYEMRIQTYLRGKGGGLSPRHQGILLGRAMLMYDSNWERAASITGAFVYEVGGTRSDVESMIMAMFRDYSF